MSADRNIYRFGNFELDPAESSLLHSGNAVSITPKALRLLHVLIQNQGHVLDKSYLLEQVWEEAHVEEGNLTYNIRQLRKILGDEVKNPKYIETVPKRGYRFIGNVETTELTNGSFGFRSATAAETSSREPQIPRRPRWRSVVLTAAVLLVAGSFFAVDSWMGIFGRNGTPLKLLSMPFSAERLSTDGDVNFAALSKSGEFMVYVAGNVKGKQSLRVRDLATGQSREILGSADGTYYGLKISADDSTVYFARKTPTDQSAMCLMRMKLIGGAPELLGCGIEGWFDLSSDGNNISYVRCGQGRKAGCSLFISDANFTNERLLVTRKSPSRISVNAISPDGRSVVFAAGQTMDGSDDFGIYKYDLESGDESAVIDQKFFNVTGLSWMPDGSTLLATALRANEDNMYFWAIDTRSRTFTPFKEGHEGYKGISIDREGSKIVATVRSADFRVFVHSLDQEKAPTALGNGWTPRFTPDGRILFASNRSGKSAIWSSNPDGTDVRHLSAGSDQFPVPSLDGSAIYFTSRVSGRNEVWRMEPDGSGARQLTREMGGYPIGVSSDGSWIYYLHAIDLSLRRVAKDGSREEQVTDTSMHRADISPHSTTVASFDETSKVPVISLLSLETNEKRTIPLPKPNMEGKHLAWSSNGENLYAVLFDPALKGISVWRIPTDGSAATRLRGLNVESLGERSAFTVSPDERYFAIAMGNWKHDAVLIRGLK